VDPRCLRQTAVAPDLQYRLQRIALEYEGEHHLLEPVQWNRDIERDDRLRAMGWTCPAVHKPTCSRNVPASMAKIRERARRGRMTGFPPPAIEGCSNTGRRHFARRFCILDGGSGNAAGRRASPGAYRIGASPAQPQYGDLREPHPS
jgi:hypothetical protein